MKNSLYNGSLEALLGLYSIQSIGGVRMRKLLSVFETAEAVLEASERQLLDIEGFEKKTVEKIKQGPDEEFIKEQIQQIAEQNVSILTYWDNEYPQRLKAIYDPPAFLFVKGRKELLKSTSIAIVGTRHGTGYGRMVTERFGRELVQNNFCIISGFARGVDTMAHKTALKNSGETIAVLGNGIDQVYPAENKKLFEQICEQGLIISESPMGTRPDGPNFPKRNRIISGMSVGVLITEAGLKSGALITALFAADQNREVFVIPGPIMSGHSTGSNNLLKQGAILVQDVDDILVELEQILEKQLLRKKQDKHVPQLKGNEKKIYETLDSDPQHVDQIAFDTNLSPGETLSILLTLELMRLIRQLAGKMFIRV